MAGTSSEGSAMPEGGPSLPANLLTQLYRRKAGQLVATLVRLLGPAHLDVAESAVQEAFLKACQHWPYDGIPANPAGWLTTVARNHAYNQLRRTKWLTDKADVLHTWQAELHATEAPPVDLEAALGLDDQLHLMFMCCHPCLHERAQVALTLKIVGGFSAVKIARALLTTEAATRKLITRAKQKIRSAAVPFAFPEPHALPERLDSVLRVLYLIFNEGYSATGEPDLVHAELCDEAIWLTSLLLHEDFAAWPRQPTVKALLALMLLQSSRNPARTSETGALLPLADQDRSLWDQERIRLGLQFLANAMQDDEVSRYHVEAQLAAYHAVAPSYGQARWDLILGCYDILLALAPNPIAALNRVVALSKVEGAEAGLAALKTVATHPELQGYYLLPVTYATLHQQLGHHEKARAYYRMAEQLAPSEAEKAFLAERRTRCA